MSAAPGPVIDRLVSIHAKLLQLVESITEFQGQIQQGGADGMMGWHDILSKYFLLTSYTHSVFELLIPPPSTAKAIEAHKASLGVEKPAYKTREEQRVIAGQEGEAWKRTLAQLTVHPGQAIEQERDFIVGVLLRTKQVPEIEALEGGLLKTIPSIEDPAVLYRQLIAHEKLADQALESCRKMKEAVDDREFQWKARVTGADDDDEEEVEDGSDMDEDHKDKAGPTMTRRKKETSPPRYTPVELGRFMREGVLGR